MTRAYGALSYQGPVPATGGWLDGAPVGARRFVDVGPLETELGGFLPNVRVAYETWGELNAEKSNAVYVCHALTGDSHVTGEPGEGHVTGGWWDALVGEGAAIDTRKWFVVCANVLGGCQGTTGPSSLDPDGKPWGSRFPTVTVADMVEVERRLTDALGIPSWALILGPSLGGMRVLEWMVSHPDRIRTGLVLGTTAAVTADQIGTHTTQIDAIELDEHFNGGDYYDSEVGPWRGMGIARRIAHLTYRSADELNLRFGRETQGDEDPYTNNGRFAVQSYLDHHAEKLARRFDANTYIQLTRAMSLFDVGRGRGGVAAALASIEAPLVVVGIDSDRLFPISLQQDLVDLIPGAHGLHILRSVYGHDGFLVEDDQMSDFVRLALALADSQ